MLREVKCIERFYIVDFLIGKINLVKYRFYITIYFLENENIRKGRLKSTFTAKDAAKLWEEVTHTLNGCAGPKRSWKEWRKSWQDIKSAAKGKAAALINDIAHTGVGPPVALELSEFQRRVANIIGSNAIHGHQTIKESLIIFDENSKEISIDSASPPTPQLSFSENDPGPSTSSVPLLPEYPSATSIHHQINADPPPSSSATKTHNKPCGKSTNTNVENFKYMQEKLISLKEKSFLLREKEIEEAKKFHQELLSIEREKLETLKRIEAKIDNINF
ncbi:uncharacterized protein LOC124172054 [Ischnura elegans]|uniref:uncharacterized protein LOC124172054 n=1 Tax=Ischnura elegans TaxID=197161 RepID=UPI001ED888D6|nr:uncharacterized protein LOC124172054 [Ischnura elegans]